MKRLSAVVSDEEYDRVRRLIKSGFARSVAQLVREAVREYAEEIGATKILNLRELPLEEARKEVERYLKSHLGVVWPDEMAEELGIDYRVVLEVIQQLMEEEKVDEIKASAEVF
ncbi:MAG: ribbon-helix-helix protein, CopG family [Candidatus Bathyarchaeia archaeon]